MLRMFMGGLLVVNSNAKGKRGELEFSHWLEDRGFEARRGQQYSGERGNPDVITSLEDIHIEVKRTEKLVLWSSVEQSRDDAKDGEIPIVVHRPSRKPWIVIMYAHDFIELYKKANKDTNKQLKLEELE